MLLALLIVIVFCSGWLLGVYTTLVRAERHDLNARDEWAKAYQRRNGVR